MTSTALVQSEIKRFLNSGDPEVLCITGEWGVGKTYTWQASLDEAQDARSVELNRYSYVSLFGINSLDGMKLAIFENLQYLVPDQDTIIGRSANVANSAFAGIKKFSSVASALPYVGGALAKAGPLYFSLIRNQIVCVDDLERRGNGLDVRDVLGLISFLREQRACKVVLLLNSNELGVGKKEFDEYFEKVIDTRLVFAPTPDEAAQIALQGADETSQMIAANCKALGIANIRVIKKIERLVGIIKPSLEKFQPEVIKQAVHSLTLFGWSKYQPTSAPPLSYYLTGTVERYLTQKENKDVTPQEAEWNTLLSNYGFMSSDEFDLELMKSLETGIFNLFEIELRAAEQDTKISVQKKNGSFEQSWRPFHDSFADNTDEVVNSITESLKKNALIVSLSNLDEAVTILKEFRRDHEAKEILEFYIANKKESLEFWDYSKSFFQKAPSDPDVAKAAGAQQISLSPTFDPAAALVEAGRSLSDDAIKQLAMVPVEEFYAMIKARGGDDMRLLILSALQFRRISNSTPEMKEVVRRMEEALAMIGKESKLNAVRVRKYGVVVSATET